MNRIIAAIDGSRSSELVLEWALDHARPEDEVVAMLVWNLSSVGVLENPFGNLNEAQVAAVRVAKSIVDSAARRRWSQHKASVPVRIDVRHGDPTAELVSASKRADTLVMGGYGGVLANLGSVARSVVGRAKCAVTLVPLVLSQNGPSSEAYLPA